tara:strand:+ start:56 stop:598 length:543 start_codon:yes stop_codon:yes gene_type:complete
VSADFYKGQAAAQSGDYEAAAKWFTLAAEQGDADAQNKLGFMYRKGKGVVQDYKTAVKWFTLSADQGDADAQYHLGFMYRHGLGVVQDYKTAVKWYTLSAEQGYAEAQYHLGSMYNFGQGVPLDNVYAYMWYNIAASSRDKDVAKGAAKLRDIAAKGLTPADISAAQNLTRECMKKYKGC